jgi:hypothetical protein
MQPAPLAELDAWIDRQDDEPTRPEAIRRLVDLALEKHPPPASFQNQVLQNPRGRSRK